jgi:hypothetical protein
MKREVRRIHWYTAEKEKTNDTKGVKGQSLTLDNFAVKRTAFFYN